MCPHLRHRFAPCSNVHAGISCCSLPQTGTSTCKTFNCAPANIAACPLTGLDPSTSYTVEVVAQKTGFPDSLLGGPDTFKTKDAA